MSDVLASTAPLLASEPAAEKSALVYPFKTVDLAGFLVERCQGLTMLFPGKLNFTQRFEMGCKVSSATAHDVGDILAVTIENAVRHAHPTGLTTLVAIDCRHLPNKKIGIDICDDGVGLPENFDEASSEGAGFAFVREHARKIDAALTIETSELGLCVRLVLPQATGTI